ncbi:MAG: transposase [Planctomycetota bacterium]|jgi:transposase
MIIELIDVAVLEGASEKKACELLGLAATTIARWRKSATGDYERVGP